jgi:Flp pilus assembly protein TadG
MPVSIRSLPAAGRTFRRYLRETTATTSAIFGLCALPIFAGVGVAVDMARANMEQTNFHSALDAAALAVAADDRSSTIGLDAAGIAAREIELAALAQKYVDQNHASNNFSIDVTNLEVDITGSDVTLTAEGEFPTTIMGLFGIDSINLDFESKIKKAMRPIELVMVLDTTGSMDDDDKLEGAVQAGKDLLETIYEGTLAASPRSEFLRVGLVPFSGAVRLDTSHPDFSLSWIDTAGTGRFSKLNLDAVSGVPSAWNNYYAWSQLKNGSAYHSWNGCVEARYAGSAGAGTDYNVNDAAPNSGTPDSLFPAYFMPDAPGGVTSAGTYGASYISGTSTTSAGSECLGLTSTQCSSTTSTNLRLKQENYRKYINKDIGAETANPTSTTSPYSKGPWGGCAVSKIVPLTHDREAVEDGLDAMRSHGITIIPEGLAWGWRVLSPTAPFTQVQGSGSIPGASIAPYDDARWQKIMVLMTDGDNNVNAGSYTLNSSRYSSYGYSNTTTSGGLNRFGTTISDDADNALDSYTSTLCQKIKDAGITLYVASFGNDIGYNTKEMLKDCATDDEYYTHATTSADLQAYFDHIGEDVINKSIYVAN